MWTPAEIGASKQAADEAAAERRKKRAETKDNGVVTPGVDRFEELSGSGSEFTVALRPVR